MREVDGEGDNMPYLVDRVEDDVNGKRGMTRVTYSSGDVVTYGRGFPVVTVVND
jgi:hypothetical protein